MCARAALLRYYYHHPAGVLLLLFIVPFIQRCQIRKVSMIVVTSQMRLISISHLFPRSTNTTSMCKGRFGLFSRMTSGVFFRYETSMLVCLFSLPAEVVRRVNALRNLQVEHHKIEAKFFEEVHALECRYLSKYQPLYEKVDSMLHEIRFELWPCACSVLAFEHYQRSLRANRRRSQMRVR